MGLFDFLKRKSVLSNTTTSQSAVIILFNFEARVLHCHHAYPTFCSANEVRLRA